MPVIDSYVPAIEIYSCTGDELIGNGWQNPLQPMRAYRVNTKDIEEAGYAPTAYSREDNLVSLSWNDLNGNFCDRLICSKRKLVLKWDVIDYQNLNRLLYDNTDSTVWDTYAGLYGIINRTKHRFFHVKFNINCIPCLPENGIYYLGTPTKIERIGGPSHNNTISNNVRGASNTLFSVELHFIQATSTKINPFNIVEPPEPTPETSGGDN